MKTTVSRTMAVGSMVHPEYLNILLFEGEIAAHEFVIAPETGLDFTGYAVTARFVRADGQNVAINGTLTDGNACVTLTASCYASPGAYKLFIYVTDANETVCVYACAGQVLSTIGANGTASGAESIIDPVQVNIGLPIDAGTGTNSLIENIISGTNANIASNTAAHAEGFKTTASGQYAHAEGGTTVASGFCAHAEGYSTQATSYAHAEGYSTQAATYAHAEGNSTVATIGAGHAEGYHTTASGNGAHAEGSYTTAGSGNSHAEGSNSVASAGTAHAEGFTTTASGYASHSEGTNTTASGDYSHAEGNYAIANRKAQHTFGEYNVEDDSEGTTHDRGNYVEIVGNGTSASDRSNARTLDWSGNEALAGSLTLGKGTANEVTITAAQLAQLLNLLN